MHPDLSPRPRETMRNRHRQTSTRSSVGKMYNQQMWSPLNECRWRARLITLFKLHNGVMVINTTRKPVICFLPVEHSTGRNQFFPRTIVEWNALPSVTVQSAMVEAFKNQIYPPPPPPPRLPAPSPPSYPTPSPSLIPPPTFRLQNCSPPPLPGHQMAGKPHRTPKSIIRIINRMMADN